MSSCDVCIGTDEDFQTQFYVESKPRARKPVKCCECGVLVPIGTRYLKTSGKWDGEFMTFRQCFPCGEIQRVFACDRNYQFTTLWDDMEYAFEALTVRSPCFNALSIEARAFLTERWWKWKERNSKR